MGNYISCTLAPPLMKNTRAARVIFPTGEVKQYKEQVINVAELNDGVQYRSAINFEFADEIPREVLE